MHRSHDHINEDGGGPESRDREDSKPHPGDHLPADWRGEENSGRSQDLILMSIIKTQTGEVRRILGGHMSSLLSLLIIQT